MIPLKDVEIKSPMDQRSTRASDVAYNIREALRAAKELIQKSELLKREIAKNAAALPITPKVIAAVAHSLEETSV